MYTTKPFTASEKGSASLRKSNISAVCRATKEKQQYSSLQHIGKTAVSAGLAALFALTPAAPALAGEYDLLMDPLDTKTYVVDDAEVLFKSTAEKLNSELRNLESSKGLSLRVVTLRKLEFETDPYSFGDKLLGKWYGSDVDNKGLLLVVTAAQDGAVTGGDKFLEAFGETADDIVGSNIPYYTRQEKFNQTVLTSVERLQAVVDGRDDPGGPVQATSRRKKFTSKEQTDRYRNVSTTVVGTLLFIAVVVPMIQYYGYVAKN